MPSKAKELRTKPDFILPCPQCREECQPEDVTKQDTTKAPDELVVLPKRYLELHCGNCNLDLWLTLDEAGLPIT